MLNRTLLMPLAVATGFFALSLPASAQEVHATVVAGHPPVFRWVKHVTETFEPAVDKALEGSGITIKWDNQFGGSLAKVGDELEAVEQGLAEIGLISSVFDPAKLPLQNVSYYTPFVSSKPAQVTGVVDKMHKDNPKMRSTWEENGLEYLGGPTGIDDYLLMTNFPVNSIEDMNGRKIAAPGPAVNWLAGTGAVGVSGNLTTYYNEIKSGVYDGAIVFATAALPAKLHEVAPYVTKVGFGAQFSGAMAANKDWFDAQPAALQDALKTAGDAYFEAYHNDLDKAVEAALTTLASQGATITEIDADFRKAWADGMDNVAKTWATEIDSRGKPGTEILKTYMDGMRAAGAEPVRNWDQE